MSLVPCRRPAADVELRADQAGLKENSGRNRIRALEAYVVHRPTEMLMPDQVTHPSDGLTSVAQQAG